MKKPQPASRRPEPCAIVIFGAGGDLTERLLLPALYNLQRQGLLPEHYAIIGVARSARTTKSWIKETDDFFKKMIKSPDSEFQAKSIDAKAWKALQGAMSYFQGDISQPETYQALAAHIEGFDQRLKLAGNVLFYLALPETFFGPTVQHLGHAGLLAQSDKFWRRVVIEKPFGHDVASAKTLNDDILHCLDESQIYRIDHFLGKETVQNIMALRFANGMFEPIWNRDYIDHVQITAAETVGVEARGSSTKPPARCATWCRTTCSSCWRWSRWSRPPPSTPRRCGPKRPRLMQAIQPMRRRNDAVRGQYTAGQIGRRRARATARSRTWRRHPARRPMSR